MITELEQCSCGIVFPVPILNSAMYIEHLQNGRHSHALNIELCGPCFFDICQECDERRAFGLWSCHCLHQHKKRTKMKSRFEEASVLTLLWSSWLAAGCPSERDGVS